MWFPIIKLIFLLIILWGVCELMVEGLASLAKRFNIPQSIAGATLAAVGSSAPEFGTSIFSILVTENGKFPEIGIATIIGSAIFNILVIIGVAALVKKLKVLPRVYSRDGVFYFITIILLVLALQDNKLKLWEVAAGLLLYGVYSFILIIDIKRHPEEQEDVKEISTGRALLYFLGSVAVIGFACHFLVETTIEISKNAGVPKTLISILILAAGTSIPDCFASVAAARRGHGAMAISNALGSNVFDVLICIGVPVFIRNMDGSTFQLPVSGIEKSIIVFSLIFLTGTLLITLVILKHKWSIGKKKGSFLIFLYLVYVGCVITAYFMRSTEWINSFYKLVGF